MAQRDRPTTPVLSLDVANDRKAALDLTAISHETLDRLDRYVALFLQWQNKTNLVAPSTLAHLWTRHIADSLQLLRLLPNASVWVDLGSGGGFPGLVLACALAERPHTMVHLVERNDRKAAFLREALRVTKAPGIVHNRDITASFDGLPARVDCVTARALAPLNDLLKYAEPLVRRGAIALFMKGRDVESELTEAAKYWNLKSILHPSVTGEGWIVDIATVSRRDSAGLAADSR